MDNLISLEQLQTILGVKESTIRALIKENDFPESVLRKNGRIIRFHRDSLLEWFKSLEVRVCC
jgi:predicted DNA-binding transcriptional regulator AlpA